MGAGAGTHGRQQGEPAGFGGVLRVAPHGSGSPRGTAGGHPAGLGCGVWGLGVSTSRDFTFFPVSASKTRSVIVLERAPHHHIQGFSLLH